MRPHRIWHQLLLCPLRPHVPSDSASVICAVILTSMIFLKHAKYIPASGLLHRLCPLPGMFLPQIPKCLTCSLHSECLIKHHSSKGPVSNSTLTSHCYSFTKSCPTHFNPMGCIMPGFPVLHCLPEFAQTHVHWANDAIQPSHSLSLLSPPALNPSSIRVFSNEWALCIRWPKYWSFSFSISPSNEYSGWISLRIDWFDLLAVQWTLQNLLQHHYLKASMLWCSAFFMVQLSTCQDSVLLYSSQYHVLSADPLCVMCLSIPPRMKTL